MTQKRSVQQAARKRKDATGENYTTALRAILAERGENGGGRAPAAVPLISDALRPGTVTTVVSSGGATNLAVILGDLVALRDAGHPVFIAGHDSGRGLAGLPSPVDLMWATGTATIDRIRELISADDTDALVRLHDRANAGVVYLSRPLTSAEWEQQLAVSDEDRPAVVWVQDIQVDAPVADWPTGRHLSEHDQVPVQLTALKDLARETGAIVAAGHCGSPDDESDWRMISGIASETVLVSDKLRSDDNPQVPATVRRLDGGGGDRTEKVTLDMSFWEWRSAYFDR